MERDAFDIVAVVTNDLNSDQRMQRICSAYAKRNLRVMLIGHEKSNSIPVTERSFDQKRITTFFKRGPFFYLEYNIRVFVYLLSQSINRLYSVDLDTLLAVGLLGRIRSVPFIFDAHEYFSELPELEGKELKKTIWNIIGKEFVHRAEKRFTVGSFLAETLSEKYSCPFDSIYNYPALNTAASHPISKPKNIILYQGKVNIKRGIEEMISAMDYLTEWELWIVGDGDILHKIEKLWNSSSSKSRIKIIGWKHPEDLRKITAEASIGLNLLHSSNANYYLSSANKVYDYIMAGVPCLTMDFPEYRKLNDEYNLLYLTYDLKPNSLAQRINEISQDQKTYELKASNCRKARRILNWEKESQKLP